MGYTNASGWIMIFFYTKVSFFQNLMKKIDCGWSSVPVPKIKFDPPRQGKSALVLMLIFEVFH